MLLLAERFLFGHARHGSFDLCTSIVWFALNFLGCFGRAMDEVVHCVGEKDRLRWLRELCQCAMTHIPRTRSGRIMRQPIIYYIYDINVRSNYC